MSTAAAKMALLCIRTPLLLSSSAGHVCFSFVLVPRDLLMALVL